MSSAGRLALVFPGDLSTRTGGYLYDRRVALELGALGWAVDRISLPATFPFPSAADLEETRLRLAGIPTGCSVLVDGLALGAMPTVAAEAASRLDLIGLVHHPLCLEAGLDQVRARVLAESESAALAQVRTIIVTSHRTAATLMALMGVAEAKITVARPGTDPAALAPGSLDGRCRMLCVGTVTPRKAQDVLVAALAGVEGSWQLAIGGSLQRDPASADRLRAAIASAGVGKRVRLLGELSEAELSASYAQSDLFVSASLYEGYGMALAEALARGLPIVAVNGGAVADTVPADARILVPPGDVRALHAALQRCLAEHGLLDRLRRGSVAARRLLPSWADTAARIAGAVTAKA